MPRAPRGSGSVFQRGDGRWVAQLPIGSKPTPGGGRRTVYATRYADSEDAANVALDALRREYGTARGPGAEETVAQLLQRWLGTIQGTIQVSSLWRHEEHARVHLAPALGHKKVVDLAPEDVRALMGRLRRTLSARSVNYVKTSLGLALDVAAQEGTVPTNAARLVKRQRVTPAAQHPLSAEEVSRVVSAAPVLPLGALWVTALYTGARLGELLALRWSDVDLSRGTLTISRTVALAAGKTNAKTGRPQRRIIVADRTKRRASARTIPLPPPAVEALSLHKGKYALQTGASSLVFSSEAGTPKTEQNVYRRDWQDMKEAAGLPASVKPHDLRHTAASALLRGGMALPEVAQVLGHGNAATTAAIYAHTLGRITLSTTDVFDRAYAAPQGTNGHQNGAEMARQTTRRLSTHQMTKAPTGSS